MLDLALNDADHYVTIKSIAERQAISSKYLEQIISILSRAGYVKSIGGAGFITGAAGEDLNVGCPPPDRGKLVPIACMEDDRTRARAARLRHAGRVAADRSAWRVGGRHHAARLSDRQH
jgi:hypothetical protein